MNKIFLIFLVPFFLLLNLVRGVYGIEKKDVADPIMQEIITELSAKMPRFINKYGTAVFVADEQITRGSLIQALYEYDKKLSSKNVTGVSSVASSGVISKKDYDFLNTKILALEKKLKNIGIKGDTAKITTKTKSASFTDMMGDLEVNMPMLLDITLENSKVSFVAFPDLLCTYKDETNNIGKLPNSSVSSISTSSSRHCWITLSAVFIEYLSELFKLYSPKFLIEIAF